MTRSGWNIPISIAVRKLLAASVTAGLPLAFLAPHQRCCPRRECRVSVLGHGQSHAMPTTPGILLVDSNPDDRALSHLILERQLPHATITAPGDPLAFAEASLRPPPMSSSSRTTWHGST